MGVSFLLTLREGLEISLVLAILFAYLKKLDRRDLFPAAWAGVALAAVVCVAAGVLFDFFVGDLTGKTEQVVEGTLAFTAAGVLTWMIFWMRRNARGISGELRGRIDAALSGSTKALTFVAFVAVAREGFETALFLVGAKADGATGTQVVVGGLAGLLVAGSLGLALYHGGAKLDLARFFRWTGLLLLLFAAGLFAKGVHEFRELFEIEWSFVASSAWTVTSGPLAEGRQVHDFVSGLLGWSPQPERLRVAAYFGYLIPILTLYLRPLRPETQEPAVEPTTTSDQHAGSTIR
ncbi:MAG: FTR1 family protein [Cryobacterium sp.]|nr:FTR1 family protein [Cryobacterium sp.]